MTILGAENAALSAVKILALRDAALARKIAEYQEKNAEKVRSADKGLGN
jgi:phosphoribosylcarboxyaminoimidazole (NCAIR) mutase